MPSDREENIGPDEKMKEALSNPEKETQKTQPGLEGETGEAASEPGEETNDVPGLATGLTYLKGPVVPARRKYTISDNLPPNNANAHARGVDGFTQA